MRVFVDANVLYAAALGGRVGALWDTRALELVTSEYAAEEALTNLRENDEGDAATARCQQLLERMEVAAAGRAGALPEGVTLPDEADVPILLAALETRCEVLVSGDVKCFGALFEHEVSGLLVLQPGALLRRLAQ
jgi:predicted nucleic acid-binding protein